MRHSRRVPASRLLELLIGLLTTLLLVVPAGVVVSGGKAPSDQPAYSYDSLFAATTHTINARNVASGAKRATADVSWASTSSIVRFAAAKAGEEGLEGLSRSYIDITKGGSIRNVGTDATHTEFASELTGAGWASRTSKDGAVQIFSKDGAKYVLRERAGIHAGWTADFKPSGASDVTLKIRLGYAP